jgi:hypothetical protein
MTVRFRRATAALYLFASKPAWVSSPAAGNGERSHWHEKDWPERAVFS